MNRDDFESCRMVNIIYLVGSFIAVEAVDLSFITIEHLELTKLGCCLL